VRAFISGIGWVTAGGTGMGRNTHSFELSEGPLPKLAGKMIFENQSFRRFGRLDRFSKVGLSAIAYALQDAGLDIWKEKREIGIIASTLFGCLATDFDYYNTVMPKDGLLADPNLFTYTLPNTFLGHASIIFGLTGTNFIINEKTNTGLSALRSALDCLSLGECGTMLAGICDVECPPDFPKSEKTAPGSVFVVLEQTIGKRPQQPYGELTMDKAGAIFFNESEIKDISMCVKKCMSVGG